MNRTNFVKLAISIGISELAGIIGSVFTASAIQSAWYSTLAKPALNPPAWVFAPVWTILYALMGVALWLVWTDRAAAPAARRRAIVIFFIQLALNAAWSILFFGFHSPGAAFVEIILLWLTIIWTIVVFYKISRSAAYALLPYLLWVSFAGYLNFAIWSLN